MSFKSYIWKKKKTGSRLGLPGSTRGVARVWPAIVTAGLLLNPDRSSHQVDQPGRAGFRCCLVMWLRVRFTGSHTYHRLVKKKKSDLWWQDPPILQLCRRFCRSSILLLLVGENHWTVEPCFTVSLFIKVNSFFFWKTSAVNWFHSHCSREREQQFFFLFLKKISLRWIKCTRTVISILFMIIFYLILLHAQKIMETVVLVGCISYVMEL